MAHPTYPGITFPPPSPGPFSRQQSRLLGTFFTATMPAPALDLPSPLLDLPMELLELVLFWTVKMRGVKRGLRLRLVCKTFNLALYPALFATRLLDDYHDIGTLSFRVRTQQPGADHMWHEYLVRRTMVEKDAKVGRYRELREVAQIARAEWQQTAEAGEPVPDGREVVAMLCRFLLRQAVCLYSSTGKEWGPNFNYTGNNKPNNTATLNLHGTPLTINLNAVAPRPPSDPRSLTLLSAAALLNLHSLAQRLLDDGHNPEEHGQLLAPAIQAATQAGHYSMLERLRRYQRYQFPDVTFRWGMHLPRSCDGNWSIIGAAIRGDLSLLQNVLDYEVPRVCRRMTHYLREGVSERAYASTPAVFDCIHEAIRRECPTPSFHAASELERHAELGNIGMVRHLLNRGRGASPDACQNALLLACRGGHRDIVLLLISYGVNPHTVSLHSAAATTHSLRITKMLLRLDVQPNLGTEPIRRRGGPHPHDAYRPDDDDDTIETGWVNVYRNNHLSVDDDKAEDDGSVNVPATMPAEDDHWRLDPAVVGAMKVTRPAIIHAIHRENIALIRLLVRNGAVIPHQHIEPLVRELEADGNETMLALVKHMCGLDHEMKSATKLE